MNIKNSFSLKISFVAQAVFPPSTSRNCGFGLKLQNVTVIPGVNVSCTGETRPPGLTVVHIPGLTSSLVCSVDEP